MKNKLALIALSVVLGLLACSQENTAKAAGQNNVKTTQDAITAIKNNDKAYEQQVKKDAQKGNVDAQALLGLMYLTQKDYTQAFDWLKKASEQGNAEAQYGLGLLYFNGTGTTQDKSKAFDLFRKSADQGIANAQALLGSMYRDGNGVQKNTETAMQWYRKAADNGHTLAALLFATMYMKEEQGIVGLPNILKWCEDFAQKQVKDKDAEFACKELQKAQIELEEIRK